MATNIIKTSDAAIYGRDYGATGAAEDEWLKQRESTAGDRNAVQGGMSWANKEAQDAQNRVGVYEDKGLADQFAGGANGNQDRAIQDAYNLASGRTPSAAAYELQAGLDRGSRGQAAVARGARGSAGLAVATGNANSNVSNMQQNAFTQGGIQRAQDMTYGRGLLASMTGQQRDQALARLGQANQVGQYNAQQNDKYGLQMGQAGLALGGAAVAQNNQDQRNYDDQMAPQRAQDEANQQHQLWESEHEKQAIAANKDA